MQLKIRASAAAGLMLLSLLIAPAVSAQSLSADELVVKMDSLLRGKSSYMKMRMTIYNPDWSGPRELEMFAYETVKDSKSFIRITAPARDRGSGFLKIGYNLWMYVPATEKVMKIPPSMMHESWMGSDFTNDDLVKESSVVKDYDHKILKVDDNPQGGKTYSLELIPKPNAPVVWAKILVWVWDQGFIPLKEQYFDESGKIVDEMIFSEIKEMGGRKLPSKWEMRSMTKPGHKTEFLITEARFDIDIDPGIFTEKNLKSKNW
jgi:outer membrane lipoprotein-sorting protein